MSISPLITLLTPDPTKPPLAEGVPLEAPPEGSPEAPLEAKIAVFGFILPKKGAINMA